MSRALESWFVVVAIVVLAGCEAGPAPVSESSAAQAGIPVVTFAADWSEASSGPLVGGAPAILRFDLRRLPQCRAVYHGGPAWGVTANWMGDDGVAHSAGVTTYQDGTNVA